jgi:hypothetical protein
MAMGIPEAMEPIRRGQDFARTRELFRSLPGIPELVWGVWALHR